MIFVDYAKRRYDAAINEIERLKQSEFPYQHIRAALLQLESVFLKQRSDLDRITARVTPAIAKNACSQSLRLLFNYTPLLGFILRSTNVRNAFETYPPLLRLARKVLGPDTKLLLSSEWDYSPFVYLPTAELPDFVSIGIPAYESSNPLLISLAGHELGHNVWIQNSLGSKFDTDLREEVLKALQSTFWNDYLQLYPNTNKADLQTDLFVKQTWVPAHIFAKRQLEEVFCDMMGLRLFSEAFLHAFAYLLSPCLPGERAATYPTILSRVKYLLAAQGPLAITVPEHYDDLFAPQLEPQSPGIKLLVSIADAAVDVVVPDVIQEAKNHADAKLVPMKSNANVSAICTDFEMVIPADGEATLTDVINAGWECYHNENLWSDVPHLQNEDRNRVLNDLILKSFEVAEYNERIKTL